MTALRADARHLDPARISLGCGTEGGEDRNVALAAVGEEVDLGVDIVDTVNNIVGVACRSSNASRWQVSLGGPRVTWEKGSPSSSSSATSFSKSDILASTSTQGATCAKYSAHEVTLGVPTCASVAVEWRCCEGAGPLNRGLSLHGSFLAPQMRTPRPTLRELSETWSKSTIRILRIPLRTSMTAAALPTPPTPITTTNLFRIASIFSSPKKA